MSFGGVGDDLRGKTPSLIEVLLGTESIVADVGEARRRRPRSYFAGAATLDAPSDDLGRTLLAARAPLLRIDGR